TPSRDRALERPAVPRRASPTPAGHPDALVAVGAVLRRHRHAAALAAGPGMAGVGPPGGCPIRDRVHPVVGTGADGAPDRRRPVLSASGRSREPARPRVRGDPAVLRWADERVPGPAP